MLLIDSSIVQDGAIVTRMRATNPKKFFPADAADLKEAIRREDFIRSIDKMLERDRQIKGRFQNSVPGNAYIVNTGAAAIALVAATAKTIMYINSGAANQPSWVEFCVGFDGVTASAVPALVETVLGTKATNSTPGTASTAFTPVQTRGWPSQSSQQAAANAATSEPTVLTSHRQFLVSPYGGLVLLQFPMGREMTQLASGAAVSGIQGGIRCTAPAAVNVRGHIEYEE